MSKKEKTLLERRCAEWGIDVPFFQVTDDVVVVYRFPPFETTPSGIYIPEDARSPAAKGILLGWGPRAADHLVGNGYELGHTVTWKRFAGYEIDDRTPENKRGNRVLFIQAKDLLGSDDLGTEIREGRCKMVKGPDGKHHFERRLLSGRKAKVLAIAADPGATPAERATAKRIAKGLQ